MSRPMRKILLLLLTMHLVGAAAASPATHAVPVHRVRFAFHNAFLMNLHHFLYDMAVHKDKLQGLAWGSAPSEDEMRVLRGAVDFYRSNYAKLDLLDDATMVGIRHALSVDDARRTAAGLPLSPALAQVLDAVAPVYARTLWSIHENSNRAWIAQARALDTVFGAEIQAGIEGHMGAAFPRTPIRDDVVFNTGTRQGAYTDEQTVMPSDRADYQGLAALEMLYHEASHTTVTVPLEQAIAARMEASGRKGESDLWHVAQFYTVGAVTRDVLARRARLDYQPYADKRGLYSGYWAPLAPVVESVWRAHMDGKISLQEAAKGMVDRLPPSL
ncbi:MAG: hypothetical protein ACJ8GW_01800 [Massilia sp.]